MTETCDHGRSTKGFCGDCRAAEKQASRDKDAADLAAGRITAEELQRKNSMFSPEFIKRCKVNYK